MGLFFGLLVMVLVVAVFIIVCIACSHGVNFGESGLK